MGRAVTHLLMNIDSSIFPGAGQIRFVTPAPVVPTAEGPGPHHWSWCSQTHLSGRRMEAGLEWGQLLVLSYAVLLNRHP